MSIIAQPFWRLATMLFPVVSAQEPEDGFLGVAAYIVGELLGALGADYHLSPSRRRSTIGSIPSNFRR